MKGEDGYKAWFSLAHKHMHKAYAWAEWHI